MSEFVKLPGSASVYKVDGSTYTPIGTPQAYAEATGQNPNGPINWSAVKNVGANYLQGKSQQQTFQATPQPAAAAPAPQQAVAPTPTFTPTPTIDLNSIYQGLYDKSGIKDYQSQYDTFTKQIEGRQTSLNDALAKINDNPFYSEATRVGRVAKLNDIAQRDIQTITGQQKNVADRIATQKADIETQLNLQTKQFDINSQQAQQAFNQSMALLQAGALDGASGEDIANLTRSTGVSSSMWQSAIDANKKKNTQTSMVQFDDGTNQGFVVVDQNGNVINRQIVAPSTKTTTGSGGTASERKDAQKQEYVSGIIQDAKANYTLKQLVAYYSQFLPIEDIVKYYNLYNSAYGPAKESIDDIKVGKFDY